MKRVFFLHWIVFAPLPKINGLYLCGSICGLYSIPSICISSPQSRGCRLVPVHGVLGTGPHSRRWAAGERAKLHLPLPIASHCSHYCLNHPPAPCPWKNCLPWNWSLVPKRLGTTDLDGPLSLSCCLDFCNCIVSLEIRQCEFSKYFSPSLLCWLF